jgi:hypothetical protein
MNINNREIQKELLMKSVFVNTGLDSYLSEKIKKGRIHDNVQEGLPKGKVEVESLYKALEKGKSLLSGFSFPSKQDEVLRKALITIAQVIEVEENKQQESIVTEEELVAALDMLDEIAIDQR